MKEKLPTYNEKPKENKASILYKTKKNLTDLDEAIRKQKNEKIRHFYYSFRSLGFLSIEIIKDFKDFILFTKDIIIDKKRRKEVVDFLNSLTVEDFENIIKNLPKNLKNEYYRIISLPEEEFMTEGPIIMYKIALASLAIKDGLKKGGIKNPYKKYKDLAKVGGINTSMEGVRTLDEKSKK